MIRESGIERRPKPWNVKMALHRGGDQRGGARYAYAPRRSPAVFLFGCMGHWHRDRDCEPTQLTGVLGWRKWFSQRRRSSGAKKPRVSRAECFGGTSDR